MVSVIHGHPSVSMHCDDVELAQAEGQKLHFLKVRKLERFEFKFHSLVQFLLKSAREGDGNGLVQFKINAAVDFVHELEAGQVPVAVLLLPPVET